MKKYFTFFLCARNWGAIEETVFPTIEKLVAALPHPAIVEMTAQLRSDTHEASPRTVTGSYRSVAGSFRQEDLLKLILRVAGKTPDVQEFFLLFENVRSRFTPMYVRFLAPRVPERVEAVGAAKIFSVSFRHALFERGLGKAQSAVRVAVEGLFAEARCLYGFGQPTAWPVSGPYQFIKDNSAEAGLRIADFDYGTRIEDVYLFNYLSESHLRGVSDLGALCRVAAECKPLSDRRGRPYGAAVYLKDTAPESRRLAAGHLRPLLPDVGPPPRNTYHLLLPPGAATVHSVSDFSFAAQAIELPHFTRVELRAPADAAASRRCNAELCRLLERLRPGILRGGSGAAELIAHYPGLCDPDQIVQRVPALSMESSVAAPDTVKLFLSPGVKLDRLPLHFLVNANPAGDPGLATTIAEWLSTLSHHAHDYGTIELVESLRSGSPDGRRHFEMMVDATRLEQDGFNLLILSLDRLNRAECIIPYLVCGDLPREALDG